MLRRLPAAELLAHSRGALDHPVDRPTLFLAEPTTRLVARGAFQRAHEVRALGAASARRGSGGGATLLEPGVLWVGLLLPSPRALGADEARLLNRAVRPVLRAITRVGVLTHYFGRDYLSASKRPVAATTFAHDATTGRAFVETTISVAALALGPRSTFEGKTPATLDTLRGKPVDIEALAARLADEHGVAVGGDLPAAVDDDPRDEPPWTARVDEAIGPVHAGPDREGRLRVGGELVASRDRVAWLEDALASTDDDAVGARVDEAFAQAGVALFGVKSLRSIRDVVLAARRASG